jgi:hypothetical protein
MNGSLVSDSQMEIAGEICLTDVLRRVTSRDAKTQIIQQPPVGT